jgi:hypothetical protein
MHRGGPHERATRNYHGYVGLINSGFTYGIKAALSQYKVNRSSVQFLEAY